MQAKSKRRAVALTILAGSMACAVGEDVAGEGRHVGRIDMSYRASGETTMQTGVADWHITMEDPSYIILEGLDAGAHPHVTVALDLADGISVQMSGAADGRFVVAADGTLVEDTLGAIHVLARGHADGLAALGVEGFREAHPGDDACAAAMEEPVYRCGPQAEDPECALEPMGDVLDCHDEIEDVPPADDPAQPDDPMDPPPGPADDPTPPGDPDAPDDDDEPDPAPDPEPPGDPEDDDWDDWDDEPAPDPSGDPEDDDWDDWDDEPVPDPTDDDDWDDWD